METNSLTFDDFSGGITDNFIDCKINQYQTAENFLIDENHKLKPITGAALYDADKPQIPLGNQRVGTLIEFVDEMLVQANKKIFYEDGVNWGILTGPTGNDPFALGDANSAISYAIWNNHLFLTNDEYSPTVKVYRDDTDTIQLRSAGLPALASSPTISEAVGTDDYIYAFVYYYEYKVGTVTFQDFGPSTQIQKLQIDTPDSTTVNITGIPVISNGSEYNWDTTNIKVKIYRTQSGGSVLYYLGEIANGTTTYDDTTADDNLSSIILYTDGGVLDNDEPPLAKTIHVANGACWYGNIKTSTGEIISNRVYQSIIDDPDSVPATAYIDLEDEIIAISSYIDRVIVLCKKSIYRLDGTYDESGGGLVTYQKISDTIGCVSASSVVQTPTGVVFASKEGFAYTDGFTTIKISDNFNTRYKGLVQTAAQRKRIYGTYDRVENRVWFAVQTETGINDDVNACYVLDLSYPISEHSTFTTAGGMESFAPTSLLFQDGDLVRGDRRGYIIRHNEDLLSFPLIDTTKSASDWYTEAIKYTFVSMATSFGDYKYRKFVPRCIIRAENVSNLSLQIDSITDVGLRERELPVIRWRGNFEWGDPLFTWGDPDFVWGNGGLIEEMRRFHGDDMRCSYRQLRLENAFVNIIESDSMCTVTVDSGGSTAVLDVPASNAWPSNFGGYQIFFENDGYVKGFDILSTSDDTLTLDDPNNLLVSGSGQKWVVKGYPKDELVKVLSLTMQYAMLGQTQTDYTPSTLGGNA